MQGSGTMRASGAVIDEAKHLGNMQSEHLERIQQMTQNCEGNAVKRMSTTINLILKNVFILIKQNQCGHLSTPISHSLSFT